MWKEGGRMNAKKGITLCTTFFLFIFYVAIIFYAFLEAFNFSIYSNFFSGALFELVGLIILLVVISCSLFGAPIRTGYIIPIILCTITYTVLLDSLNFIGIPTISGKVFILLHLILLFSYLLIVMPMLVVGKR